MKRIRKVLAWWLCAMVFVGTVACSGEKSASGKKSPDIETQQEKSPVSDGKHREKGCSSSDFTPDKVVLENNNLSLPGGLANYGQSSSTLATSMAESGATAEEINAALNKNAKGDLPEGANIAKVIVDGYKDGVLIAGAAYLGPAASVGKVVGGAIIAEIANGTYQWFDINSEANRSLPENQQKTWDYKGSISTGITGILVPGRGVWQNAGIAAGGTFFTDGPDKAALIGTGAGWAFGTVVGVVAPPVFGPVLGSGSAPAGDIIGAIGGEFISNAVKDEINGTKK